MNFERIGSDKIKVTLDVYDLELMHINYLHVLNGTPEARSVFELLMRKAKEAVNFDAGSSSLVVEAFPTEDNSFFMIVTKVTSAHEECEIYKKFAAHGTARAAKISIRKFDSFEDVLHWSSSAHVAPISGAMLYEYKSAYYLVFAVGNMDSRQKMLLSEYAVKQKNPTRFLRLLREHGKCIIDKNAVETLRLHF